MFWLDIVQNVKVIWLFSPNYKIGCPRLNNQKLFKISVLLTGKDARDILEREFTRFPGRPVFQTRAICAIFRRFHQWKIRLVIAS